MISVELSLPVVFCLEGLLRAGWLNGAPGAGRGSPRQTQHNLFTSITRGVIGLPFRSVCCGMDISESAGFGMSFRVAVQWRLSTDALAHKLRWLRADAHGQLFQGECLQQAMKQMAALDIDNNQVNMLYYLGMYSADCGCDWCSDRRRKHDRESECLPGKGQVRLRMVSRDAPAQSSHRDVPALQDPPQNPGWLRDDARIGGYSRLSDADARPKDHSVLKPDALVRRKHGPKTERYAVRKPIMNDMLMRLRCGKPSVDAFADCELHNCDKWWGPGSSVENSLDISWKEESLVWCNPPWSLLKATVSKIIEEKVLAVLVCPHWPSEEYYRMVQPFIKARHFYKKGSLVFEVLEGAVGGCPWPVWALLVDGAQDPSVCRRSWNFSEDGDPKFPRTSSSSRRWRRKWVAQELC